MRELAWTAERDGWKVSAFAQEQATRHGWPRANYESPHADVADRLPAANFETVAEERFANSESVVPLDGRSIPLTTTSTGAFDVESEPGSAYDAIIGLGTGPIRTAVVGQYTLLHPLRPGEHEIYGRVDLAPGGGPRLDVTYNVHVG